jgi:hypothetical protein
MALTKWQRRNLSRIDPSRLPILIGERLTQRTLIAVANDFLRQYVASGGNVRQAAGLVGIDRGRVYRWRLKNSEFAEAMAVADDLIADAFREELSRRAFIGPERLAVAQEHLLDQIRETSNDALVALLRYHDRRKLGHPRNTLRKTP